MGVEVTQVKVDVTGDAVARGKLDKLDDKMDKVKASAQEASAAIAATDAQAKSGLGARWLALKANAKKRGIIKEEGLEFGGLEIGREGFRVSEEFRKGARGGVTGPLLRGAFVGAVAGNALGSALESTADLVDFIKQRPSWEEVKDSAKNLALDASSALYEASGAKTILRGITRLSGVNGHVFDTAFESAFAGDRETTLQAEIREQGERNMMLQAQARKLDAEVAERRRVLGEQREQAEAEFAQLVKGLKVKIFSGGASFGRSANQQLQDHMRNYEESVAREKRDKRIQQVDEQLQEMEGL